MVKQRVKRIFSSYYSSMSSGQRALSSAPFKSRDIQLRKIEGWYSFEGYRERRYIYDNGIRKDAPTITKTIKLSCRYNDILRAADSIHFRYSCFRPGGAHGLQPIKRLLASDWAVIYMPDKAGNVMARAWIQLKHPRTIEDVNKEYDDKKRDTIARFERTQCECNICRAEWDKNKLVLNEALRNLETQRTMEINQCANIVETKPVLLVSPVQGNNLLFSELRTALASVAVLEETDDVYL